MTFEEFKRTRYEEPPYDLPENPYGFNRPMGSDISAHLPFLEFLARQCYSIVEFGTRDCYSTCAFLQGCKGKVTSYDIISTISTDTLLKLVGPDTWDFIQKSTVDPDVTVPSCELLFIDTLHTYQQVSQELLLHAKASSKWILFHDTVSFPEVSVAVREFMVIHPEWKRVYEVKFNHGLLLLEKQNET